MAQTRTGATASQNSEQSNSTNFWEQLAEFREVGEDTRKMIVAHGKITDAVCIVSEIFSNEYGAEANEMLQPLYDAVNASQKAILDLMCDIINTNLNTADNATI